MAEYSKGFLSYSDSGRGIVITTNASPGTDIHEWSGTGFDEVWLYGSNFDSVARSITVQFGGTGFSQDKITVEIEPNTGLVLLVPGLIIGPGKRIRAFGSVLTGYLNIYGYVNQIRT